MAKEYEGPVLGENGQYHFLGIVESPGKLTQWHGVIYNTEGIPLITSKDDVDRAKFEKERLTKDEFLERYKIPERLVPENCFIAFSEGNNYPDDVEVAFVNNDTGLIVTSIYFDEIEPERGKKKEDKRYKPAKLFQYEYEYGQMDNPITNEPMDGALFTVKGWDIDSLYRRRDRDECRICFGMYEDKWDPQSGSPRIMKYMPIESTFEAPDEDYHSVRTPVKYVEKFRAFHFPEVMILYFNDGENKELKFLPGKYKEEIFTLFGKTVAKNDIPLIIGEPSTIDF